MCNVHPANNEPPGHLERIHHPRRRHVFRRERCRLACAASELNPIQRPTSEYAVGPYGWLMTSAFFSLSVASFALVHGLRAAWRSRRTRESALP